MSDINLKQIAENFVKSVSCEIPSTVVSMSLHEPDSMEYKLRQKLIDLKIEVNTARFLFLTGHFCDSKYQSVYEELKSKIKEIENLLFA